MSCLEDHWFLGKYVLKYKYLCSFASNITKLLELSYILSILIVKMYVWLKTFGKKSLYNIFSTMHHAEKNFTLGFLKEKDE